MRRDDLTKYKLPDEPGVYLFKKGRRVLYIGKATSLRDRVRSYFAPDIAEARGARIRGMVDEATCVSYTTTGSVLEALLLEAELIKRRRPPYNVDQKDNTSFNYIVITKEAYPRILLMRGRDLFQDVRPSRADIAIRKVFGPFPEGGALKEALKIIRRIFPYRDACTPEAGKPCFNRQIGLCPGICSGEMGRTEYAARVSHIESLLKGHFKGLTRDLTKAMRAAARAEAFEEAAALRRQIHALEHIRDVSLIKRPRVSSGGGVRIEGYDVAHTSGKETVAVMTVIDGGEAVQAAYRKFKIRSAANNDVAALAEVLERRLVHTEWPLPRVIVVDGGKAQMNAARRVLAEAGVQIPLVGVVKDKSHRPSRLIGNTRAIEAYEQDILRANSEAHRFAISWHRRRRGKLL